MMNAADIENAIKALAEQIHRQCGETEVALVGIRSRGDEVACRVAEELSRLRGNNVPLGVLDISLYRDDYAHRRVHPTLQSSEITFDVDEAHVILIDDVLFSGRTIFAAFNAINDYGRPRKIELAVLIDRGHRQLPIAANYVGATVETTREDKVVVHLRKTDGRDAVELISPANAN